MADAPEIMTADEAGEFLRFTPEHVRRLARGHRIPARKIGSEWRFSRVQLVAWIEAGGTTGHQPPMPLD